MKLIRRLLVFGLIAAALWFGVRFSEENSAPIAVHYLLGTAPETKLWLVLLCAFGGGAVIAGLLCSYGIVRLGLLSRRYRKLSARLESEIHQLRNLPLSEDAGAPAGAELGAVGSSAGRSA